MPTNSHTKSKKAYLVSLKDKIEAAYAHADKAERQAAVAEVKAEALEVAGEEADQVLVSGLMKDMEADVVRSSILKTGMRIDGRDTKTVRPIVAEVGLCRAHMGHRCSHVVRHRRWSCPHWEQGRMSRSLMR